MMFVNFLVIIFIVALSATGLAAPGPAATESANSTESVTTIGSAATELAGADLNIAKAKKCRMGGIYCGTYLLKIGDYTTKMIVRLRAHNVSTQDYNIKNSLWACIEHDELEYIELCSVGCVGGNKREDYCDASGSSRKRDDEDLVFADS
ncbi:hypothetical protein EV127DRAFT_404303 [Xylaria flabelliformis]|nr:hypothetical protein EV127DRAFT_404303 [Xylaria flabelliformis]KAI0856386.1 hypothetical protein F4860DRAFT_417447 [Xylaria cubensis]